MSGKKLAAAQKELAFAKKAVDGLRTATAPDEEEYHWKEFIGRLTRFWNKTESALKGDPKFYKSPHVERVKGALKSDELIRYLSQARHADEHRHEEITGVMPGGVENVSSSGQVRVRNPKITINGVTMDVPHLLVSLGVWSGLSCACARSATDNRRTKSPVHMMVSTSEMRRPLLLQRWGSRSTKVCWMGWRVTAGTVSKVRPVWHGLLPLSMPRPPAAFLRNHTWKAS